MDEYGNISMRDVTGVVEAVDKIGDMRRKDEQEKILKDAYTAADILEKAMQSKDPETQRQLQTQFSGYDPLTRHKAFAALKEKQGLNQDIVTNNFKAAVNEALPIWNKAQSLWRTGDKDGAVQSLVKMRNTVFPDGKTYEAKKTKGGDYEWATYDYRGEKVGSQVMTPEQSFETAAQIMSRPDNMFQEYLKGYQELGLKNRDLWDHPTMYKNERGETLLSMIQLDRVTGNPHEVWTLDNKPIAKPSPEEMSGFKKVETELPSLKILSEIEKNKALTRKTADEEDKLNVAAEKLFSSEIATMAENAVDRLFNAKGMLVDKDGNVYKEESFDEGTTPVKKMLPGETGTRKELIAKFKAVIKKHTDKRGNVDEKAVKEELQEYAAELKREKKKDVPELPTMPSHGVLSKPKANRRSSKDKGNSLGIYTQPNF